MSGSPQAKEANNFLSPESEEKMIRDTWRALIMLPSYSVFDNLAFKVESGTVALGGQVTRPVLKNDAGRVGQRTEGVDKVINNIKVLPPSPMDDLFVAPFIGLFSVCRLYSSTAEWLFLPSTSL